MLKRLQINRQDGFPGGGVGLSLLLAIVLLAVAAVTTAVIVPFEGWRNAASAITIWIMALASLFSAWLCWRERVVLGVTILITTFWMGVLFLALVSAGFGLVLGVSAFVVTSAVAAQTLPGKQISRIMAVGALVGGLAFVLDFFGPADRLTVPDQLRMFIFLVVGVTGLVFSMILFWQFRKLSLLTKLLLPIVVILLFSIGVMAAYNYILTRQALLNTENQALRAAAQQTATAIGAFMDSARTSLIIEAKLPVFVDYMSLPEDERLGSEQEAQALSLLRFLQARGYILSYALLDNTGRVWLSTASSPEQADQLPPNLGIDLTDRGFLNILLLTGEPYISPVIFGPNEQPSLYFAMRIDDTEANPVGVLVSQYHASNLQAAAAQSNNLVGAGSFAVLLDENNLRLAQGEDPGVLYKLVAPPDLETYTELVSTRRVPDVSLDQIATNYPLFQDGLEGFSRTPFFTTQEAGTGEQTSSVALVEVPGLKWKVAFMQPQSAFLQPVENQSRTAILLAIGIAVLVAFAVGIVARVIVQPVTRLTNVAKVVTAGDLAAQAQVESQDEIGTLAMAFNTMTTQLRQTLEGLEQRMRERTAELEKASDQMRYRASQLQTVSDVARAIATVQDIDHLLPRITQTVSERFGFYHVGIFLLDPRQEYAVLRAANSEGGRRMLARGHRLKVGQVGIVGYVSERGEPRIALDVGQDAVFFDNPDLPETRSEMALPLKIGERVIGALDVQSTVSAAFKDEDIVLLTTLADQVAIAIENSRLFSETRQALVEAQSAQREYLRSEWEKVTTQQDLIGYQYTYGRVTSLSQAGNGSVWNELDQQDFNDGKEYLTYNDQNLQEGEPVRSLSSDTEKGLVIPISLRGQVIGMVKLQDIDQTRTWDEEEISLIKAVADQVGLALENARLLEATQRRAEREYLVGHITTKLRASNDPQVILQTAVTELRKALRAQKAQVIIRARPAQEAEPEDGQNQPPKIQNSDQGV